MIVLLKWKWYTINDPLYSSSAADEIGKDKIRIMNNNNNIKPTNKTLRNRRRRQRRKQRRRAAILNLNQQPILSAQTNLANRNKLLNIPQSMADKGIELQRYFSNKEVEYYAALLDPEYAYKNKIDVKMPAPINLPTVSVHQHNSWEFNVNNSGKALITWRPGLLATTGITKYINSVIDGQYEDRAEDTWRFCGDDAMEAFTDKKITIQGNQDSKTQLWYSQVTINNSNSLTGDGLVPTEQNIFVPMSKIDLPITKYRLVSAKMTITYNGKLDDTSGTIIAGEYVGGLTPQLRALTGTTFHVDFENEGVADEGDWVGALANGKTLKKMEVKDNSPEMASLENFDNILALDYPRSSTIRRGQKYSFTYYPFDPTNEVFKHDGQYCDIDNLEYMINANTVNGEADSFVYAPLQGGVRAKDDYVDSLGHITTYNYTSETDRALRPYGTYPTFVCAVKNVVNAADSIADKFEIHLYENYEVVVDKSLNMLSKESPVVEPAIAKEVMNQQDYENKSSMRDPPKFNIIRKIKSAMESTGIKQIIKKGLSEAPGLIADGLNAKFQFPNNFYKKYGYKGK